MDSPVKTLKHKKHKLSLSQTLKNGILGGIAPNQGISGHMFIHKVQSFIVSSSPKHPPSLNKIYFEHAPLKVKKL